MNRKIYLCRCDAVGRRKKIRATSPLQIQLCPEDMTADIITVDIASRNLAGRHDCCAEFSTAKYTDHNCSLIAPNKVYRLPFTSVLLLEKVIPFNVLSLSLSLFLSLSPLSCLLILFLSVMFTCKKFIE